jgi:predicted kinase
MKTIYFLQGLPASGKSTWAKTKLAALNRGEYKRAILTNKDEIRKRFQLRGITSEMK